MGDDDKINPQNMRPHNGHRQRMYKRFYKSGLTKYQPHEVLEQLLFQSVRRMNTNQTGHGLIERFGSVYGVLTAEADSLVQVKNIGEKSAESIAEKKKQLTDEIVRYLGEIDSMSEYDILFAADWFMGFSPCPSGGLIFLSRSGKFHSFSRVESDGGGFDISDLGRYITKKEEAASYYLFLSGDLPFTREDALSLRSFTALFGKKMNDALYIGENRTYSLLNDEASENGVDGGQSIAE